MDPKVTAAVIEQVGSLVYLCGYLLALQYLYSCYVEGDQEKAWLIIAWRWWQHRREARWRALERLYSGPSTEEPRPELA